jgi:hypothetical protein
MKIRVMVAALGFVGGLPLISTNLFAREVPPSRCASRTPRFLRSRELLITTCCCADRPPTICQGGRANQLQL